MTRYRRDADDLNAALDLGPRDAFRLDLGQGPVSYPGSWPKDDPALGLVAYQPELPPPVQADPLAEPLEPWRFHAMIEVIEGRGKPLQIMEAIDAIPSLPARAAARARYQRAEYYVRTDPLMGALAQAADMTEAELDAAWLEAQRLG